MLSRDPNSLANLDQDLPNYLQHNVRIHSLPQVSIQNYYLPIIIIYSSRFLGVVVV